MAETQQVNEPSTSYEVHYLPPDYPEGLFPGRCTHPPQFKMVASMEIARKRGRNTMEIDHSVCFGCGRVLPSTYGGNVLVDLVMIAAKQGPNHWKIASRAKVLLARWSRIATYLFDENGWRGRHRAIAEMIDPNLTMRIALEGSGPVRMARISYDALYLRPV